MLKTPNLDDQNFEDIVEEAIKSIPYVYPEWTNHNANDPGITMLELFAWYKEMQQYHLNCTTERTMDMYLKLLGMKRGEIAPASAWFALEGLKQPLVIAQGDELTLEGGTTFTFAIDSVAGADQVRNLILVSGERRTDITDLVQGDHVKISLWKTPEEILYIGIVRKRKTQVLDLLVDVADDYPVARNPFAKGQRAGRRLLFSDSAGNALPILSDETFSLSQTGRLSLCVAGVATDDPLAMGEMLWICVRQLDAGCEETPQIQGVYASFAEATQKKVLVMHADLTCTGKTLQVERTTVLQKLGKCFLLARDIYGWRHVPVIQYSEDKITAQVEYALAQDLEPNVRAIFYEEWMAPHLAADGSGEGGFVWPLSLNDQLPDIGGVGVMVLTHTAGGARYCPWTHMQTLEAAGPLDSCFSYDSQSGALLFGDNLRGEVAPKGVDSLLLTDYAITLGAGAREPMPQSLPMDEQTLCVRAISFASGAARESTKAVRARLMQKMAGVSRAVTEQDFAQIALRTPGLRVMQAGAIAGYDPERLQEAPGCVTVVALPYSTSRCPMPDEDFIQKVSMHLETVRPICTRIQVVPPVYIVIAVSCTVFVAVGADDVENEVRKALEQCFASSSMHWRLGETITEAEVVGAIGQLEGVLGVKSLVMTAQSARAGRNAAGDILLPPHALPALGALQLHR